MWRSYFAGSRELDRCGLLGRALCCPRTAPVAGRERQIEIKELLTLIERSSASMSRPEAAPAIAADHPDKLAGSRKDSWRSSFQSVESNAGQPAVAAVGEHGLQQVAAHCGVGIALDVVRVDLCRQQRQATQGIQDGMAH